MLLHRRLAAVAVALSGALAASFGGFAAAAAADGPSPSPSSSSSTSSAGSSNRVTFGIGTATKGVLDRRQGIQAVVSAGDALRDQVVVVNESFQQLTLNVYAVDVINDVNGNLQPQVASAKPVDSATWVTLQTPSGTRQVVVPARSRVFIPVVVKVPAKATVGDHLAGLMASLVAKGQSGGQIPTNIDLDQRVGVKLAIRVAGQLRPELSISNLTASYTGTLNPVGRGSAQVSYVVTNTGNVRLGGRQSVSVRGLVGSAATVSVPDLPVLLPGGSATVTTIVPDVLPALRMTADVIIDPAGAQGDANPNAPSVTASTTFWAVPWTLLALLVLIGLLTAWWLRRRRQPQTPATPGRRQADARRPDEALTPAGSLAPRSATS